MADEQTEPLDRAFEVVTGADPDGRNSDAPPSEVHNFFRHALSLSMTKTADGLLDPKLVLSWLLNHLGVPSIFIGMLVPIREAGALLPQIFISNRIMARSRRKLAWAGGSAVQGIAVGVILLAALALQGWVLGAVACCALAVLAVARSFCSVSYKDVLGRTVGKSRRGTVTGLAGSVASAGVILFGGFLLLGWAERQIVVFFALAAAALLWFVAAAIFAGMDEAEAKPQDPTNNPFRQFALLRQDTQLARFVAARGLLVATALAPPYLILMSAGSGEGGFQHLGLLLFASAGASMISSYVWGRMADWSSRRVLIAAGAIAGGILTLAAFAGAVGIMGQLWVLPLLLFVLMVSYHGVRQARSTYLVDMAPEDRRAAYTAVSNTLVGLILLAGGLFGLIASALGPVVVVAFFAALSFAGAVVALGLNEVEALAE
ncbi:MFS transporter [Aliiroseovarius sp. YM-037]|uniref:MFS transporter n=1 Tax=Aliiroseovarius sp. YM-037 TaxID=3341728 RepID=UPI003A808136